MRKPLSWQSPPENNRYSIIDLSGNPFYHFKKWLLILFFYIDYLEEEIMFEVTESAVENLKAYLSQNNIDSAVRVALMQGGWAGPSLGLALDESKENDEIFKEDELTFLVEQNLLNTCGSIKIDFIDAGYRSGFSITSANPIGGGGCSSGSCATGSCG
jgi:iron-sulfur cluster assembly protein